MEVGGCWGELLFGGCCWGSCWGAFACAFAEKPPCSAHTVRPEECLEFHGSGKALGNSGSRLGAQKKMATQGAEQTALALHRLRQFQERRGSLRDRLEGCWGLLRKKACLMGPWILDLGPMVTQGVLQRAHKRDSLCSMSHSGPATLLAVLIKMKEKMFFNTGDQTYSLTLPGQMP